MPSTTAAKVRGTTIHIGTSAADRVTDTYTEIKGAKMIGGQFGVDWKTVDGTILTDTYEQPLKTIASAGSLDVGGLYYFDDPGQVALKAAAADTDNEDKVNFKIIEGGNGRITYLTCRVMSFTVALGTNTVLREFKSKVMPLNAFSEVAGA